jgi:aspartate/methionine/tyrosine aminotransferase
MERIGTETAFEAAARARALEATGRDVIHLEIGEPDFDTPRHVSEAAVKALLEDKMTHYPPAPGIAPLRKALAPTSSAGRGSRRHRTVVVTPGARSCSTRCSPSSTRATRSSPIFPIYESMADTWADRGPAPLREANDFRMDVEDRLPGDR